MKQTLLFALFFSFNLFAFGQNYQGYVPFPDSNVIWIDHDEFQYGATNTNVCSKRQLELSGDTIIDSNRYVKVNQIVEEWSHDFGFLCTRGTYTKNSGVFGYFRNDSINKKVWVRFPQSSADQTLYDFDLNLGDTLDSSAFHQNYLLGELYVDSIDTVFIADRYRKRFWLVDKWHDSIQHHSQPTIELIEGIGSNRGFYLLTPAHFPNYKSSLSCVIMNSYTVYPDSLASCQLITGTPKLSKNQSKLEIYPNPSDGSILLSTGLTLQSIEVYNLQGQKVQEVTSTARSWQMPEKNGLYLIRMQDVKGNFYMDKVIRTN